MAPAAIGNFRELIKIIDYVSAQLDLPWWQKDYGPLPGWAWGGIGVTALFGGAFYVRKKRKAAKARAPKTRVRRTSRAA